MRNGDKGGPPAPAKHGTTSFIRVVSDVSMIKRSVFDLSGRTGHKITSKCPKREGTCVIRALDESTDITRERTRYA